MNHEQIADVFEKSAALIDSLEAENASLRQRLSTFESARTSEEVEKLAKAIESVTGDEVDREVITKIASSEDEDVKTLLRKLSFAEEVPRLGSVRGDDGDSSSKTAGEVPPEDQRFLNFILDDQP